MKMVTPESVGVSSEAINTFLSDLQESRFNMHSILILRHGKLITEAYREPYDKDRKHRMFSISKTFTAYAAGLLIDEGKLSLDDKVASFFPEYNGAIHPLLASATIHDMLTMRDPHNDTTHGYGMKANWLESWFLTPPNHPAGTIFKYNTTSTNLVAAIVERITGMKMMDYMYPRLLTPMGFSEGCVCWQTPNGDSFGGSAVFCTPRDLAKLVLLTMNDGMWEGKQLISADFVKSLRSKIVDTSLMGIPVEGMFGYGYFTWQTRYNGFALFGIHGQFGIGFPDNGLVVVATGNTTDNYNVENDILYSQFLDRVYKLLPGLSDAPLKEAEPPPSVLPHIIAPGAASSPIESNIVQRTYKLHANPSGWQKVSFDFNAGQGKLTYANRRGEMQLSLGMGKVLLTTFPEGKGHHPDSLNDPYDVYASGGWVDERTLAIHVYDITIGYMQLNAVFEKNEITILIKPDVYRGDYGGYMYGMLEG
ncbi:MAG: beta-lactamase family protein [Defluviitaleaceae bacterium]|nr:beta-lactamase family protein [Defluviitaleaceae bacterium]